MSLAGSKDLELNTDFPFTLKVIKIFSIGYALFRFPLIWSIGLLFAAVMEILCLLRLAGMSAGSWLVILSVISIGIMMALLIATPTIQTIFSAPSTAFHRFNLNGREVLAKIRREIPSADEFKQLSPEDKEKMVERIRSILLNDSSDSSTENSSTG